MSVPASRTLWLIAGFTLWSAAFVGLYAMLSVGCAFGWQDVPAAFGLTLQRVVLLALWLVSLAGAGGLVVLSCAAWMRRRDDPAPPSAFLAQTGYLASLAAFGSTAASFLPIVFVTACI